MEGLGGYRFWHHNKPSQNAWIAIQAGLNIQQAVKEGSAARLFPGVVSAICFVVYWKPKSAENDITCEKEGAQPLMNAYPRWPPLFYFSQIPVQRGNLAQNSLAPLQSDVIDRGVQTHLEEFRMGDDDDFVAVGES